MPGRSSLLAPIGLEYLPLRSTSNSCSAFFSEDIAVTALIGHAHQHPEALKDAAIDFIKSNPQAVEQFAPDFLKGIIAKFAGQ